MVKVQILNKCLLCDKEYKQPNQEIDYNKYIEFNLIYCYKCVKKIQQFKHIETEPKEKKIKFKVKEIKKRRNITNYWKMKILAKNLEHEKEFILEFKSLEEARARNPFFKEFIEVREWKLKG